MVAACASPRVPAPTEAPQPEIVSEQPTFVQEGVASWYGASHNGHRTASGEIFDMTAQTAAHRTLGFGSVVRVTNLANGRSTWVRINDRGPYAGGRVIDLSARAARDIGMQQAGLAPVRIELYDTDQILGVAAR